MIHFRVNGKEYSRDKSITVAAYLSELKLPHKSVIVEHNREFLEREQFDKTKIKDGDSLEIVRAFAGG